MSNVIDTLILELGIDSKQFETQAAQTEKRLEQVEKSLEKSEKATAKNEKQLKKHSEQQKKATSQVEKLINGFKKLAKELAALTTVLLSASGLAKLAADASKANQELDNLAKNMNTSRRELAAWQGAANMAGGSASGMAGYMQQLSGEMNTLVMQGNAAMLPYFNALGVSMLDGAGKARAVNDVMLDLSDSFASMERSQAHSLAQQMGIDDATFNALVRGRAEMERLLAVQKSMYHANEQDIENSRKFNETRALLSQQWDSLLLMIGNALLPVLIEVAEISTDFMSFLIKNENLVKGVFWGIAGAIGLVLIPMFTAGLTSLLAFIAPFAPFIATVTALAAAFGLLYDDYKTWAEGGQSLFDWGKFTNYINTSELSVKNLVNAFAMLLTGYKDWATAGNSFFNWLKMKGFIDETGVSVQSLTNGFRNLASDLRDFVMPYLQDFVEAFNRLKDGDFSGAWESIKRSGDRAWSGMQNFGNGLLNRITGAADIATGHNPQSVSSLSAMVGASQPITNGKGLQAITDFGAGLSKAYDDVVYKMGGKNIRAGNIDCSGYIDVLNKNVVASIEKELGETAARKVRIKASGGAAGILQDQDRRGNRIARAAGWQDLDLNKLQAGMIIGEARGSHAKGRYGNIGHIVQIIERNGQKFVTESTSDKGKDGKSGVRETLLSDYVKNLNGRKFNVFVADPYRELRGQVAEKNTAPMFGGSDWQRKLQAKETVSGADGKLKALSQKYDLPSELLYSVWTQESMKGNLKQASSAGAKGHFQFMPKTAAEFGITGKEWDFDASAEAAARKYRGLLKMYQGDVNKALAAYNYGEGNVNRKISQHGSDWLKHTPKETQTYVANIRNMMQHRQPVITANAPIGGAAVSGSLNRHLPQMSALQSPKNVNNHTEVVVQNVSVQTSASTMTGTGADMMKGIAQHANQFNNGLV
ncbi:transglycosylase SLT domain-containing protein [Wielerella bovis]|uniref:transglycosylase SLT domain-containing protein n=1 Tax=Wielerella bovis TaxID=2917790 RepID=UPI00201976CE|nr:transglycosylase SLT domain-containing protein [Wielerella bovis]ULJ66169.1 transglycosylase SLT domain-containing protein [Wielerella bovis]